MSKNCQYYQSRFEGNERRLHKLIWEILIAHIEINAAFIIL